MEETIIYEVQIHEAGPDSKARLKTLFDYMQSAADRHSKSLGTSLSLMSGKNLTWVYTRFYTVVEKYPAMYDKVYCKTWRSEVMNGLVSREFILTGDNGSVYVKATSSLALIDRTSRKPVPIPDIITSNLEHGKEHSIDFSQESFEQSDNYDYIYNVKARFDDIDVNMHMNNAAYAGLFFESVYQKYEDGMIMNSIDIKFRGEVRYGDLLECYVFSPADTPGKFYHKLFNKTKGRVSAYAVTEWENKL